MAVTREVIRGGLGCRRRRRGGSRVAKPPVEPGSCAGGARAGSGADGEAGLRGLRADVAGRARTGPARRVCERGRRCGQAGRWRCRRKRAKHRSRRPRRGAGRAVAVGQLGSSVAQGPGAGRSRAGGVARRRDDPDAERGVSLRAPRARKKPARDHQMPPSRPWQNGLGTAVVFQPRARAASSTRKGGVRDFRAHAVVRDRR